MKKTAIKKQGLIAKLAMGVAKMTANSACIYLLHQPKLPAKVQKLRKF